MKNLSVEKARLIEEAARYEFRVTGRQIDRWRLDRLVPPPGKVGGGRARGVRRPSPHGTTQQLVRLCQFLSEDRSLDRAAFRLWIEDYDIPLERLRMALAHWTRDLKHTAALSPERIRDNIEDFTETLRRGASIKPHVKKMANDGKLQIVLESFLAMHLGRPTPLQDERTLGAAFEEFTGLDRARIDYWEGRSPWQTGDPSPQVKLTKSLMGIITVDLPMTASAQELSRAKAAFKNMLKLRRCAELLQQVHGNNVFGFAAFTDSLVGGPITRTDPIVFLAFAAISRLHPQLLDAIIETGRSLDATLDALGQQVANATINKARN